MAGSLARLDLAAVFWDAPAIYSVLVLLSCSVMGTWLYSLLTIRKGRFIPRGFIEEMQELILSGRLEGAVECCHQRRSYASQILASALAARHHGPAVMLELAQSEGKRTGAALWQRLSLMSDVAAVAPMLGLLGTVLGMFCAFYDSAHAADSLQSIFDGLGIAMGTTVAGLLVAILAMLCYTTLRVRVVKLSSILETEVFSLLNLVKAPASEA
ncbi:MAG: MotA/TolQ/ExbB proton channel family protein [Chlamydiia bacterium]|nr:MotA/TolQ/ExbB proton channel family protein [Chlamydiia bacterium]